MSPVSELEIPARADRDFDDAVQIRDPSAADRQPDRPSTFWSWVLIAVPLVIVLVGAWNFRWVQEDAFIDFRVIGNLLAGQGPVFNVGERVEAYSDPLWVFTLAGLHEMAPFLSLPWLSVIVGLGGTAAGVLLSGRAVQRIGTSRDGGLIMPIGLLIFAVVAGVWEFATSGLEMGMVFGWIGLSFWLLVRTEARRSSAVGCAFAMGLGGLIRPELVLMSGVFMVGLAVVVAAPGWRGPTSIRRRWLLPMFASLGLPLAYELFRMAYFGMVVSNSALAKSAGGSNVPQGVYYVENFVTTYALWVPLLLVLPLMVPRIRRWWTGGDYAGVTVIMTPLVAGLFDGLYVLHLGGDYMQARLLLPAFLCLCLVVFVDVQQIRTLWVLAVIGITVWAVICGTSLRYDLGNGWVHNMHDERGNWITATGTPHPIDINSYLRLLTLGEALKRQVTVGDPGHKSMLVLADPGKIFVLPSGNGPKGSAELKNMDAFVRTSVVGARSALPFRIVVNLNNIGALAYLGGSQIYVDDALSLANPIGSHTTVAVRGIPGHEKSIGPEWMIARFGVPGERISLSKWIASPQSISAARKALGCAPLREYLRAISTPLTLSQAISNVYHALSYTAMKFSPDANDAERQLCG